MAAHTCRRCGQMRARSSGELCPVCWLVRELRREHRASDHDVRSNSSCRRCAEQVARSELSVVRSGGTSNKENDMTLPTKCVDCGESLRRKGRASSTHRALGFDDMCGPCYDQAGLHNEHVDGVHDDHPNRDCKLCDVPSDATPSKFKKENTMPNTTRSHFSHASCAHPRTPAGRAKCRKQLRNTTAVEKIQPTHVRVGKNKTVHAPGGCATVRRNDGSVERTEDEVTCKSCKKVLS